MTKSFNDTEQAPTWIPEQIEEIASKEMTYYDRLECLINTDLHVRIFHPLWKFHTISFLSKQLISENTSDYAHFVSVHDKPSPLGERIAKILGIEERLIEHVCDHFSWEAKESPNQHQAMTLYKPHYRFFGTKIANASVFTLQSGPCIYTFRLGAQFLGFTGKRIFVVGITPIHANKQKLVVQMYSKGNTLTRILDRLLLLGSFKNVSQLRTKKCVKILYNLVLWII